eukprot:scaffold5970_cov130-Cylindrotheca_fusiformis.AAC.1
MEDNASLASKKSLLSEDSSDFISTFDNGTSTASGDGPSAPIYIVPTVAKGEEANILRAKCLVAFILILAAATVATSAYHLVQDQARNDFETKFAGYASEILTVSRQKADQLFHSLDSFSAMVGSQAASENALRNTTWPFYTIPDFTVKAQRLVKLLGASVNIMLVAPVVQEHERDAWNDYASKQNPVLYEESLKSEGNTELSVDLALQRTLPFIHTYNLVEGFRVEKIQRPGEVLPNFQQYPLRLDFGTNAMTTNYDIISHARGADLYEITKKLMRPTMSFTDFFLDREQTIATGSQIMQPIYDTGDTTADDRKIVAINALVVHWLDFFKNSLTEGQDGVVVVLRSACPVDLAYIYGFNATDYEGDPEDLLTEDVI